MVYLLYVTVTNDGLQKDQMETSCDVPCLSANVLDVFLQCGIPHFHAGKYY